MADTPSSGSGPTNIESLQLDFKTNGDEAMVSALDKVGTATIASVRNLDGLNKAVETNQEFMARASAGYQNQIQIMEAKWRAEQRAIKSAEDLIKINEAIVEQGSAYIAKLSEMVATYNMTTEALQRYKAEQLQVLPLAAPLIAAMEEMRLATERYGVSITKVEQIEGARLAWEQANMTALNAQRIRSLDEIAAAEKLAQEKLQADMIVFQAFKARTLAENAASEESAMTALNAQRIRSIEENRAAEESAMTVLNAQRIRSIRENQIAEVAAMKVAAEEKLALLQTQAAAEISLNAQRNRELAAQRELEESSRISLNAQRIRALEDNKKAELAEIKKGQEAAIALAEKQAIEEIAWSAKSLKAKIADLERLQAFKASSAITPQTIESTFSSAAIKDIGNLAQYQRDYAAAVAETTKSHKAGHGDAKNFGDALDGISFKAARARSEIVVLAHEAVQGRFSRMPASMMVLAEYTNAASLAFTGMGIAALTAIVATVGFIYEIAKGSSDLVAFNKALTLTGGYAGQTRDSLRGMAEELKGSAHGAIGTTTNMLEALIKTGKFSDETLKQVGRTALEFQMLSGQSTEQVASFFSGLVKVHGKVFNDMTNHTADWAAKANEQYHFLSAAQYEHIRLLALEGSQSEAIIEIMDNMHESFDKHDKRIGVLVASYRGWVMMLQEVTHWLQEVGKDWFHGSSKGDQVDIETKKWENLIRLRMEAKNGRAPNTATGDPGVAPNPSEVAMYDDLVKKQRLKTIAAQKDFDDERLATQKKADLAVANQEGVEAQRHLDYQEKFFRTKAEKEKDEIAHTMDAAMRVNRGNQLAWEYNYAGTKENMQKDMELAIKNGELKQVNEEYVLKQINNIKKKYAEKGGDSGPRDGREQELAMKLEQYDSEYKLAEQATKNNEKLLTDAHKAGILSDTVFYESLRTGRDLEQKALDRSYTAKLKTLEEYSARSETERKKIAKQASALEGKNDVAVEAIVDRGAKANQEEELLKKKQLLDTMNAISAAGIKETETLEKQIVAQKKHNVEIGKSAEERSLAAAATQEQAMQQNELDAAYLESLLANNEFDASTTAVFTARMEWLKRAIADQKELNDEIKTGAALEAQAAIDKKFTDLSKKFGDDLGQAIFDGGTNGFKRLIRDMSTAFARTILRPILQPITDGMAGFFYPGASTAGGVGGADGLSGGSSAIGTANALAQGYKALSGGFAGVGSSIGAGVAGFGNFVGSSSISAFGSGMGMTGAQASAASSAYNAAGMSSTGSAIQAGSYAGSAAAIAAGVYAGVKIGASISGEFGSRSTVNAGTGVGAVVGAVVGGPIGAAIGAAIGGTVGGLLNRAFGMGDKKVTSEGMSGTLSASGVTGSNYSNWHQDGGWFRSDKNGKDTSALSTDVVNSFTSGLSTMKLTSLDFAKSLGITSNVLDGYSKNFDIKLTSDAAANQKAITDFFITIGDEMANKLVPNLSQFAKSGESASVTLQRLSDEFKATDSLAMSLGRSAASMFKGTGLDTAMARDRVITAMGGTSNATSLATTYAQNFLTESQKLAPALAAVNSAMSELGYSGVDTREKFASLVNSLVDSGAIMTDAGAKQFADLMNLSGAFATTHAATEDLTKSVQAIADEHKSLQDQYDQLTMTSAQLLTKQRNAIDASNRSLFDQVQAAQKLKDAQDAAKTSLSDVISKMKSFGDSAKALHDGLLTGSLSTLTPEQQYAETRRQYESTLALAKGGDTTAQGQYSSMLTAFLTASRVANASDSLYSADFAKGLQDSSDMANWALGQVDVAQASLDALNAQVIGISDLNVTMLSVADTIAGLPAAFAATPALIMPAPVLNYSTMGAANTDALVAEIKGLRADLEVQSGLLIAAQFAAAALNGDKVAQSNVDAALATSWSTQQQQKAIIV